MNIRPFFTKKRLSQITTWQLERFKAKRREEVSPRTVNAALSLLRRMFNLAIDWGLCEVNPYKRGMMLAEQEKPTRILSLDEQERLLAAAPDHLRDLIEFALNTGMRRGEILSLKWERVDWARGEITVAETKTRRVRTIGINSVVAAILKRRRKLGGQHIFTWNGKAFERFDKTWAKAVNDAGIPRITFHDLRHTFATRLVELGYDIAIIRSLLGHRSIVTTQRYAHPQERTKRKALADLSRIATATPLPQKQKRAKSKRP